MAGNKFEELPRSRLPIIEPATDIPVPPDIQTMPGIQPHEARLLARAFGTIVIFRDRIFSRRGEVLLSQRVTKPKTITIIEFPNPQDSQTSLNEIRSFIKAAQGEIPDIDTSVVAIYTIGKIWEKIGVDKKVRQERKKELEEKLYAGTAQQQIEASNTLELLLRVVNAKDYIDRIWEVAGIPEKEREKLLAMYDRNVFSGSVNEQVGKARQINNFLQIAAGTERATMKALGNLQKNRNGKGKIIPS